MAVLLKCNYRIKLRISYPILPPWLKTAHSPFFTPSQITSKLSGAKKGINSCFTAFSASVMKRVWEWCGSTHQLQLGVSAALLCLADEWTSMLGLLWEPVGADGPSYMLSLEGDYGGAASWCQHLRFGLGPTWWCHPHVQTTHFLKYRL